MFMKSYNLKDLLKRIEKLEASIEHRESISNWNNHYKKEYKWEKNPDLYYAGKHGISLYIYESAYNNVGVLVQKRTLCNNVPSYDTHLVPARPESE